MVDYNIMYVCIGKMRNVFDNRPPFDILLKQTSKTFITCGRPIGEDRWRRGKGSHGAGRRNALLVDGAARAEHKAVHTYAHVSARTAQAVLHEHARAARAAHRAGLTRYLVT